MDAPPARRDHAPWLALIVPGVLLIALGGWRLATWAAGPPERYLLIARRVSDANIQRHEAILEKAKADLAAGREQMTPTKAAAEQVNIQQLTQIRDGMLLHRKQDIETARSKELKLGVYVTLLGLGLLGLGGYRAIRSRRPAATGRPDPR